MFAFLGRHRIESASAPGIATQDSFSCEVAAVKQTVNFKRVECISRTRRLITASRGQNRRDDDLVKMNHENKRRDEDFLKHFNK